MISHSVIVANKTEKRTMKKAKDNKVIQGLPMYRSRMNPVVVRCNAFDDGVGRTSLRFADLSLRFPM